MLRFCNVCLHSDSQSVVIVLLEPDWSDCGGRTVSISELVDDRSSDATYFDRDGRNG